MPISKKHKILLVDSNQAERTVIRTMLTDLGQLVCTAQDAHEAINKFTKFKPDFVILDVVLDGQDGIAVAKNIKRMIQDEFIPIIFITALSELFDVTECLEYGDDVMNKPIEKQMLSAKIKVFERIISLNNSISRQRDRLGFFNDLM